MQLEITPNRAIGDGHPCFVVAEIGQNHNGDAYTATRLLKAAHDAGVDAVKLCKRHIPSELTAAEYRKPYTGQQSFGTTYGEHREALELTAAEYAHLKDRMRYNQWPEVLFATACDRQSVDDIEAAINPPLYKIASRDLNNLPLLDYVARLGKPIMLSAGMATDAEIRAAKATILNHHDRLVLMVCTSEYPTPNEHVYLRRIPEWREQHDVLVGLSDHTAGITAGICGVALGACVVEKHITLSRAMKGTDHAGSLEPDGLRRQVAKIREVEAMMQAHTVERFAEAYALARSKLGRSLVTVRAIRPGEVITESDVCLKSPGTGVGWMQRDMILGKMARRALPADVTLYPSDVLEAVHVS